jgi:hypothetical protein
MKKILMITTALFLMCITCQAKECKGMERKKDKYTGVIKINSPLAKMSVSIMKDGMVGIDLLPFSFWKDIYKDGTEHYTVMFTGYSNSIDVDREGTIEVLFGNDSQLHLTGKADIKVNKTKQNKYSHDDYSYTIICSLTADQMNTFAESPVVSYRFNRWLDKELKKKESKQLQEFAVCVLSAE